MAQLAVQKRVVDIIHSLSKGGLQFATTNQNVSALAEQQNISFAEALNTYSTTFSSLEWKTDLKTLIAEATLFQLSTSHLTVIVRIEVNTNAFKENIGFHSELWKQFISQINELPSRKRFQIIVCLERTTLYSRQLLESITELKEQIFPIPLALECEHRSWKNPESIKIFRGNKTNIIQRDMPHLSGFQLSIPNYDSRKAYLRLLGRNQINWFSTEPSLRYGYDYQRAELSELATQIQSLKEDAEEVYIIGAHRPASVALSNILEIAHIISVR
jgi:uncharacterized protein YecE (DUF72 family)